MMTRAAGSNSRIFLTVSTPCMPGMMMSIKTKSGGRRSYSLIASSPLVASLAVMFLNDRIRRLRWNRMKAESSTTKHVIGDDSELKPSSVSNITFLSKSLLPNNRNQIVRDVLQRQNRVDTPALDGHARHAEDRATLLVLSQGVAARLADGADPLRPVAAHAGHNQGD